MSEAVAKYCKLTLILLLLTGHQVHAQIQQTWPLPESSFFNVNPSLLSQDALIIQANHSRRWRNVRSSPRQADLSVQMPFRNDRMSLGIQLGSERVGPFASDGIQFAYAYGFQVGKTREDRLTLGVSSRLQRIRIDHDHFIANNESDPTLSTLDERTIIPPTVGIGLNYATTPPDYAHPVQLLVGVSVNQVLPLEHRFESFSLDRLSQLFAHLGLNIGLSQDFELKPTLLIDATERSETNYAVRLEASYLSAGWVMVQYSKSGYLTSQLGILFDAGGIHGEKFQFSASNSWYFGNISGELGNGLLLSFGYHKPILN